MTQERILELLQDCIDNIIEHSDNPLEVLEDIGFTKDELMELGFSADLF